MHSQVYTGIVEQTSGRVLMPTNQDTRAHPNPCVSATTIVESIIIIIIIITFYLCDTVNEYKKPTPAYESQT